MTTDLVVTINETVIMVEAADFTVAQGAVMDKALAMSLQQQVVVEEAVSLAQACEVAETPVLLARIPERVDAILASETSLVL